MKKLLIGLGLALICGITQAATVSWSLTNVMKDGVAVSGKMYLCVATESFTRDTILGLAGKGADAFANALNSQFVWQVTNGAGGMAASNASRPTNEKLGVTGSQSYDFFAVIFNTDKITDKSYFYVTANKTVTPAGDATSSNRVIGFGSQATASAAEGAWKAVPEPTTGLLLLLGMAGLALRRKQA